MEILRWHSAELPSAIDTLLKEALATDHEWAAEFKPAWQAHPFIGDGEALLLAWQGADVLAMAAVSADPHVADGQTGRLRFIYVRMAARRQGIAERLVSDCLMLSRGHWRKLRLHTDNPVAARLYERYGFEAAPGEVRATHILDMTSPKEA